MLNASTLQHLSHAHWAHCELATTPLPDERLRQRLFIMAHDLARAPELSIPKACVSWNKIKAAYRFFEHEEITPAQLLAGHYEATHQRVQRESIVLAVQDTTTLDFSTHRHAEGLGPVRHTAHGARGLLLHSTLAFTPEGAPLGLLHAQMWSRDPKAHGQNHRRNQRPLCEKESRKWLESFAALAPLVKSSPRPRVVSVADREGDLYELLAAALQPGAPALLVRAQHNRQVSQSAHALLWDHLSACPAAATVELLLPRRPGVPARRAACEIRFGPVTLRAPTLKENQPALGGVWCIDVRETGVPAARAIHWRLLTTLPVESVASAQEKVRWYLVRWQIEIFHRTLKSGCAVERLQLDRRAKLERAVALKMIIAWRVMALAHESRCATEKLASELLSREELVVLLAVSPLLQGRGHRAQTLTLRQAARAIANLGGFIGRKGDGDPGVMSLWRGFQRLTDMTTAAIALHKYG